MTDRLDPLLRFHPFTRLNTLLQGIEPGHKRPLLFSVGEPQQTPPDMIKGPLVQNLADWGRYPLAVGTPEFRRAATDWLNRRFHLPVTMIDPDRHLMPIAGTRQGLFFIALAALQEPASASERPVVLMPNPFYHVYAGAAAMAGGEPVFLPATAATGFLPDPDSIDRRTLERTALAYVCSPANPQGVVAAQPYLARWLALARHYGFTVAFDECYSELYRDAMPPGALEVAAEAGGSLDNLVVFHSLSKRSAGAGLRSGFIAGDERMMKRIAQLVNYGGVAIPYPILAASTALWRDEAHVAINRALYNENFALARRILGNRMGATPAGGFFLWLDVGNGETVAKRLWAEAGVKVLPGGYMARADANGQNPGERYIRVALVYDAAATQEGLERMARVLTSEFAAEAKGGLIVTDEASGLMRMPFLPDDWRPFLKRRAIEAGGLLLLLLAAVLLLSLLSYNVNDPSLNTATGSTVRNLMGYPGSVAADLLLQALGIASLMLVLVPAVWGWRVLRHRVSGLWWLRLLLLPFSILSLAMALAALGTTSSWFLPVGLGGYAGDLLLPRLANLVSLPLSVMAILGFLLWAGLGYLALGISARGYVAAWHRLQQAGDLTGRMIGAIRRRFARGEVDAEAAEWRAEQAERQRRRRVEPHLDADEDEAAGEPAHAPVARITERAEAGPRIEAPKARPKPGKRAERDRQPALDLVANEEYTLPPLELLAKPPANPAAQKMSEAALEQNARLLESVLQDFGVRGEIVKVRPGPVVTLYELEPAPGTKTSRVVGLADDIARSMSAVSVRVAVVPGRSVIGIELPNQIRETVMLRELLASDAYERTAAKLALILGKDIGGQPVIVDLARMPHLLIAGTTGSGKSVAINTMILSLLYRLSPDDCKFIMIDPKMLELSVYDGIPHLLTSVVTDPRKAVVALKWTVREMENRYRLMSKLGVRNIEGFNIRITEAAARDEKLTRKVQTGFDPETGGPIYEEEDIPLEPLPFIVVVVDEMADLMLVAGKDIEAAIQRLAQMARAAGIHIIMATQRPSVDVITGTIKANFPTRVSFHVTSKIDSRTILSETGAEQLLGQGDMLYMAQGGRITRVHGPFVADQEVESIVKFLKKQGQPTYIEEVTQEEAEASDGDGAFGNGDSGDALYDQAVAIVCRERKASTSFVQRHLQIGYNRAARIVERMEREGVVSTANHVGKREVLGRNIDGDL